jgi:hypothetical protein
MCRGGGRLIGSDSIEALLLENRWTSRWNRLDQYEDSCGDVTMSTFLRGIAFTPMTALYPSFAPPPSGKEIRHVWREAEAGFL